MNPREEALDRIYVKDQALIRELRKSRNVFRSICVFF